MDNIDIMPELLPVMENVVFLDLSANGLTDDAAKVIAGALKTNSNLKRLHLFRNAIGKAGLEALFQAIFDTRSMNSIIESNHSCDIYAGGLGGKERSIISLLEYDVGGLKVQFIPSACCGYEIMLNYPLGISDPDSQTEQQIRLHKVYLALGIDQPQSFNSKLLCDLPLAIMPKLLEWVQKASEEIAARTTVDQEDTSKDDSGLCLKNIFEVVKNCIVPMAYAGAIKVICTVINI